MKIDLRFVPSLRDESIYENDEYDSQEFKRRREVLKETVSVISKKYSYFEKKAEANLKHWLNNTTLIEESLSECIVQVFEGDWGEITKVLTQKHGKCFAVLNMANAYIPGGGYLGGAVAQEENIFRRTDCHFTINVNKLENGLYKKEMIDLINGVNGVVYLDSTNPRICIRGQEKRELEDLGYEWLTEDEIFPFFEMRAAAIDVRSGQPFSDEECLKRIRAQFNTLKISGIKYVVLGAHGCGAFLNPPEKVAEIYKKVIDEYKSNFCNISFAIFNAGYGPDNYSIFKKIIQQR